MKTVRQTLPGAWVCTNDPSLNYPNHGRKAVHHNKIYLKDLEEFEIELFNPMSENVLAVISLDGKPISKTGLVVRAGQRVYLDCFYDDRKKFVFKTYEVDNTSEVQSAIAKNGMLEIQFFKEKILKKYEADKIVHHHYHYRPWYWNNYLTSTGGYYSGSTTTLGDNNTFTYTSNANFGSILRSANLNNSSVTNETSTASFTASIDNLSLNFSSMETGQVDKGSASNQQFYEVEMDFEDTILNRLSYQLLPESRKPVENSFTANVKKIKLDADDIEINGNLKINGKEIAGSKVSQLLELKQMLNEKLIDQNEFEILKKELLA